MTTIPGTSEILQLSPDESSTKAAKGLVVPSKWPRLEFDDSAVWGECQGSGYKPYRVQYDVAGQAFRCSCPSRKFPCKHSLALLLLLDQHRDRFQQADRPDWVAEWLDSRRQRAEKQASKAAEKTQTTEPADPQAAARREESRRQRMAAGLDDLERWLADRLRQGLAQLSGQIGIWEEMAARMVDAQLPGMALRLRRTRDLVGKGEHWPSRVLARLGEMQLLIESFRRVDSLPEPVQTDVRTALGLAQEREAVLATGERVADDWFVLGQSIWAEDRLWVRRVWLHGRRSGRRAVLLDYAHGARRFDRIYVTSSSQTMTLAFFQGNHPLRALALDDAEAATTAPAPGATLDSALDDLATALAANPWQWPQPILLDDGVPQRDASGWCLRTAAGNRLPLDVAGDDGWLLVAESGGRPLTLFGEWDGAALQPLSCWNPELVWSREAETA